MLNGNIDCLPRHYLLFLADPAEHGFAKTALDLRDSAGERYAGELALPAVTRKLNAAETHVGRICI